MRTIAVLCLLSSLIFSSSCSQPDENRKNIKGKGYRVIPEYNRTLKKVAFSLSEGITSLNLQHEFIKRLPEYSEIILLLPRSSVDSIKSKLRNAPYGSRTKLVSFSSETRDYGFLHCIAHSKNSLVRMKVKNVMPLQFGTLWVQDLFEVAKHPDGKIGIFASAVHMCFWTEKAEVVKKPISDIDYISCLSSLGMEVVELPFVFNGGNILFDEIGGKRIALCGSDIIRFNQAANDLCPDCVVPNSEISGVIKDTFNVDEVIFVGGEDNKQPALIYHLDQSMVLLDSGIAGIVNIIGDYPDDSQELEKIEEVELFLVILRKILLNLGYKLVDLDIPARYVLRYQLIGNAVAFLNAVSGKRTIFLPIFSSDFLPENSEIVSRNIARLKSVGYTVIPLPSSEQYIKGGPHCMINVLE